MFAIVGTLTKAYNRAVAEPLCSYLEHLGKGCSRNAKVYSRSRERLLGLSTDFDALCRCHERLSAISKHIAKDMDDAERRVERMPADWHIWGIRAAYDPVKYDPATVDKMAAAKRVVESGKSSRAGFRQELLKEPAFSRIVPDEEDWTAPEAQQSPAAEQASEAEASAGTQERSAATFERPSSRDDHHSSQFDRLLPYKAAAQMQTLSRITETTETSEHSSAGLHQDSSGTAPAAEDLTIAEEDFGVKGQQDLESTRQPFSVAGSDKSESTSEGSDSTESASPFNLGAISSAEYMALPQPASAYLSSHTTGNGFSTSCEPIIQPEIWFTMDSQHGARHNKWHELKGHRATQSEQLATAQSVTPQSKSRSRTISNKLNTAGVAAKEMFQLTIAGLRSPRSTSRRRPSEIATSSNAPTSPMPGSPFGSAVHSPNVSQNGSLSPYRSPPPLSLQSSFSSIKGVMQTEISISDARQSADTGGSLRRTATEPVSPLSRSPEIIRTISEAFTVHPRTEETFRIPASTMEHPSFGKVHIHQKQTTNVSCEARMSSRPDSTAVFIPPRPQPRKVAGDSRSTPDSASPPSTRSTSQTPQSSRSSLVRQTPDFSVALRLKNSRA